MISPTDARAIIDMETRAQSHQEKARALQLCITHLSRDAAELGLEATYRTLLAAAETIDMTSKQAN
jgi:hypothetical protein